MSVDEALKKAIEAKSKEFAVVGEYLGGITQNFVRGVQFLSELNRFG